MRTFPFLVSVLLAGAALAGGYGMISLRSAIPSADIQPASLRPAMRESPDPLALLALLPPEIAPLALATPTPSGEPPFTAQAPFGAWHDPRQDYGCEEATALMAVAWARQEPLTLSQAEREITAISDFEQTLYHEFHDTSIQDTAERILTVYLGYRRIEVRQGITTQDIWEALGRNHVAIVAVNGQKLANPFYTPPGPIHHMILVYGYDAGRDEFITHDPGTRQGRGFRYPRAVLESALQDYPTGWGAPLEPGKTGMIVVYPSS